MAAIQTKFSVDDTCYTFESWSGQIKRHTITGIMLNIKGNSIETLYDLTPPNGQNPLEEQELYTEIEVKELANCWLLEKSVSIFSKAGL